MKIHVTKRKNDMPRYISPFASERRTILKGIAPPSDESIIAANGDIPKIVMKTLNGSNNTYITE